MSTHYGARPADWQHLDALGLGSDLLPVVSRPDAKISPKSSMKQLGKTPSQYNGGQMVVGISRWTDHQASDAELKRWMLEADYGICIQTRLVRALDVDVANEVIAAAIVKAAKQVLGIDLPMRRRPNTGKCLLAFRLAGEFPKRVMKVEGGIIEFLGNGQQFIAVGTHPSGARYEWVEGLPETFPEITAQQFEDLWGSLELQFAIEEPKEFKTPDRRRGQHLDVDDPIATWLYDHGLVLGEDRRGGLLIECPWEHEHSGGEAGDSSTMWLIAGTNGHGQGHFRCLHSHCDHRTRQDYLAAIGYQDDVLADFEDLGPLPDGEAIGDDEHSTETAPAARFEVIPAVEFTKRPAPAWLVKNLIPDADLVVLYGESGSGKSFVMIDIAMAIARGVEWRGLRVRQGRVVYIAAEGGGGFRNRLLAYAHQHQVDLAQVPFGVIHAAPNFLDKGDAKAVVNAIKAGGPVAAVVIDTWAQVTPGANENAAEDMGKALRHARQISDATGAVAIIVHHSGKDASKGARGWSGIRAAADAELEVTRNGASRAVRTTKQKDGDDEAAWGFKLETVTIGFDEDGDPIDSCVVLEAEVGPRADGKKREAPVEFGAWETVILETYAELMVGGQPVMRPELVITAADKMAEPASVKIRRASALRALKNLCKAGRKKRFAMVEEMVIEETN